MPLLIPLDPAPFATSGDIEAVAFNAARTERGTIATIQVSNGDVLSLSDVVITDGDDRARVVREVAARAGKDDYGPDVAACLLRLYPDIETGMRRGESRHEAGDDDDVHIEAWPQPLSDAAYYSTVGAVVRAIAPETEGDPAAILVSFLAMAGAYIGGSAYTKASGKRHAVNEYAMIVGKSSRGVKGSSNGHLEDFFGIVDPEWYENRFLGGLSSGEGMMDAVRDPGKPGKDGEPAYEGVIDKRTVFTETEFAGPLRRMMQDSNSLSIVMRQAWDGSRLATVVKHNATKATGAHISIIGHITQEDALRWMTKEDRENGFANRFLWCCSDISLDHLLPDGGNDPDFGSAVETVRSARALALNLSGPMMRDREASALWYQHYRRLRVRPGGIWGVVTGRAAAHVMRLSALYALLDRCTFIKREHLQAALEVWRYCEESVQWVFSVGAGTNDGARIIDALTQKHPDRMARTELSALFGHHVPRARIDTALRSLMQEGAITQTKEPSPTGRGPRTTYYAITRQSS